MTVVQMAAAGLVTRLTLRIGGGALLVIALGHFCGHAVDLFCAGGISVSHRHRTTHDPDRHRSGSRVRSTDVSQPCGCHARERRRGLRDGQCRPPGGFDNRGCCPGGGRREYQWGPRGSGSYAGATISGLAAGQIADLVPLDLIALGCAAIVVVASAVAIVMMRPAPTRRTSGESTSDG